MQAAGEGETHWVTFSSPVCWKGAPLFRMHCRMWWGGGSSLLGDTGTKKEEQAPGKAREGHTASPAPSPSCQICEEFRSISRKIYEKPNSIEELAELREWMKGIPEKLVGLEVRRVHGGLGAGDRQGLGEQEPGGWE